MKTPDRALLEALLRNDLTAFAERCFQTVLPGQEFLPNWHIEAITYQLKRVLKGEIRRLIVTLPPRSLKSICAPTLKSSLRSDESSTLVAMAPPKSAALAQVQ